MSWGITPKISFNARVQNAPLRDPSMFSEEKKKLYPANSMTPIESQAASLKDPDCVPKKTLVQPCCDLVVPMSNSVEFQTRWCFGLKVNFNKNP